MKPNKPPPVAPTRKTQADLRADLSADHPWDSAEYRALVAAGLRAPNMRHFTITSAYAWALFRPEPSMLPQIPLLRHNPVERDED